MSEESLVPDSGPVRQGAEGDRKSKPKVSAEENRRLVEAEYRKKKALIEQTLPPVETAFSRGQSPLFGKSAGGEENRGKMDPSQKVQLSTSSEFSSGKAVSPPVSGIGERGPGVGRGVELAEEPGGRGTRDDSLSPGEIVGGGGVQEGNETRSVFLREGVDPNVDAVYENIATQLRDFKRRRKPFGGIRLHMRVSADVFSAVSELGFAKRLDKVEIVTFLLRQHLPKAPYDVVPRWMLSEGEETTVKEYALPYLQDSDLEEAFRNLQFRFQLYRVDVLEAIVLHYLPAARGLVKPKRRVRARVVSKLGGR